MEVVANEPEKVADYDVEDGQSFDSFWGWYTAVSELAKDDITKIDEVTRQPLLLALNHLSYLKDKNNELNKKLKKYDSKL